MSYEQTLERLSYKENLLSRVKKSRPALMEAHFIRLVLRGTKYQDWSVLRSFLNMVTLRFKYISRGENLASILNYLIFKNGRIDVKNKEDISHTTKNL